MESDLVLSKRMRRKENEDLGIFISPDLVNIREVIQFAGSNFVAITNGDTIRIGDTTISLDKEHVQPFSDEEPKYLTLIVHNPVTGNLTAVTAGNWV